MKTTLVTMVTSRSKDGEARSRIEMRDALTQIITGPVNLITFTGPTQEVEVQLTGAERIALIEGLGGKVS